MKNLCNSIARAICFAVFAVPSVSAQSAPVVYDTEDYRLIVCRPFDSWTGDELMMERQLDEIRAKQGHVNVANSDGSWSSAASTLLEFRDRTEFAKTAASAIERAGFRVAYDNKYPWAMGLPTTLDAIQYPLFRAAQLTWYQTLIQRQGDPDGIERSVQARRVLGNLLAVASVGYSTGGLKDAGKAIRSGLSADAASPLPSGLHDKFAPFNLPDLDPSQFIVVDVLSVRLPGSSPGQVVIAYRHAKTAEVEQAAKLQAVLSIVGTDTSAGAIAASRNADLAYRKRVWAECVSTGACGGPTSASRMRFDPMAMGTALAAGAGASAPAASIEPVMSPAPEPQETIK